MYRMKKNNTTVNVPEHCCSGSGCIPVQDNVLPILEIRRGFLQKAKFAVGFWPSIFCGIILLCSAAVAEVYSVQMCSLEESSCILSTTLGSRVQTT